MEQRQLRELLDLAVEGADYVQSVFERGLEDPATTEILDQLQQVARLVEQRTEDTQGLLQDTQSYAKNVQSSLDEMARNSDLRVRIMSNSSFFHRNATFVVAGNGDSSQQIGMCRTSSTHLSADEGLPWGGSHTV